MVGFRFYETQKNSEMFHNPQRLISLKKEIRSVEEFLLQAGKFRAGPIAGKG